VRVDRLVIIQHQLRGKMVKSNGPGNGSLLQAVKRNNIVPCEKS